MSTGHRSPPRINGMSSLKVDNISYRTTIEEIRRAFSRYGEVGDVYIPRDPRTNESRGFAFVRYYSKRDAEDAIDAMDGYKLDSRPLRVQMARYKRPDGIRYRDRRSPPTRRRRSTSRSRSLSRSRSASRSRDHVKERNRRRSRSHSPARRRRRSYS